MLMKGYLLFWYKGFPSQLMPSPGCNPPPRLGIAVLLFFQSGKIQKQENNWISILIRNDEPTYLLIYGACGHGFKTYYGQ